VPFQVEFDFAVLNWCITTVAGSPGSDDQERFLLSSDSGATWTALASWDNTSVFTPTGSHYVFDATAYSGDIVQFAVWASEGTVNDHEDVDVFFDNLEVRPIPACPEPTQLRATNQTPTTAELSWLQSGSATLWNIEVVPAGTTPTGTPTESGVSNP